MEVKREAHAHVILLASMTPPNLTAALVTSLVSRDVSCSCAHVHLKSILCKHLQLNLYH